MFLKRALIFDAISNTTPLFHKIAEEDNIFDRAFRASNAKIEGEIEEKATSGSKLIDMTNTETFDFSRLFSDEMIDTETFDFTPFVNNDMRPTSPNRSLCRLFNTSPPNFASSFKSFDSTALCLHSSDTPIYFGNPSYISTPHVYTDEVTETEGFQTTLRDHQQYQQNDSSAGPRQLDVEPRNIEYPLSPFAAMQQIPLQTPANAQSSSLISPASLFSEGELLEVAPILDGSGQKPLTSKCKRNNALNTRRSKKPVEEGKRSRKVRAHTKEEVAATRKRFLLRNRQAAYKCREKKKIWVTDLLERKEFFTIDNAKQPYEIEQTMLELNDLRTMAVEHYRVCLNPGPEFVAWYEKEAVRLQHGIAASSIHQADGPHAPPPQDANYTGKGTAGTSSLIGLGSLRQDFDGSATMSL